MAERNKFDLSKFEVKKAGTLKKPRSITVFGPPGRGKTVFAASIAEVEGYDRVLLIDVEGGAVSVGYWYPTVDVVEAPTAAAFEGLYLAALNDELLEPESGLPYQAIIVDTFDKAQSRQLSVFDNSPESRTKTGEKNTMFKWGAIKAWSEKVADIGHQSPKLVIFVLHSDLHTDDETGRTSLTVMLQGSARANFPSTSDLVGYFDITNVKEGPSKGEHRSIDFRPTSKVVSKQRFADRLNGIILDPTMKMIYEKIAN